MAVRRVVTRTFNAGSDDCLIVTGETYAKDLMIADDVACEAAKYVFQLAICDRRDYRKPNSSNSISPSVVVYGVNGIA